MWMNDDNEPKPSGAELVNGLGVILGDILVQKHGFEWMNTRDVFGESITTIHPETKWHTFPINFVWKRVDEGETEIGFFKAIVKSMTESQE
jgi:hypothetical protein